MAESAAVLRGPGKADGPGSVSRGRAVRREGQRGIQPISSNALPLVSFTNFSTKGIESTAKQA
ncbi:hypothetical protein EES46_12565 [Streptomyces sp. ADI98-10]|nr:hypothetical protein EES46_12565 [Streptomyces sp. ADI98-10]